MRKRYLIGLLWLVAFSVAMGVSYLIPPMQSPDENSHIFRAYLLSQGFFLLQPEVVNGSEEARREMSEAKHGPLSSAAARRGGMIDVALLRFVDINLSLARHADQRLPLTTSAEVSQLRWTGAQKYVDLPGAGYYFAGVYAPQVTGFALGQALDLTIEHSYQLARALSLVACFFVLSMAAMTLRPNPLVAAIILLPMSVFQLVLPTIDGITMSLSVLVFSLFMRLANPAQRPAFVLTLGLVSSIFLLATSRMHLLPLLAMPFYLAWKHESRRDAVLGCLLTVGALAWVFFALQSGHDSRVVHTRTTGELLMVYLTDPAAFFRMLFNTLNTPAVITFYQQSFIGILGWLDTALPSYAYALLWMGLAFSAVVSGSVETWRQDWSVRLVLLGLALASVCLIFLALLVAWTPDPATIVLGVQGRYFTVPAIAIAYALSGFHVQQSGPGIWISRFSQIVFSCCSLVVLVSTLLDRYH